MYIYILNIISIFRLKIEHEGYFDITRVPTKFEKKFTKFEQKVHEGLKN